MVEFSEKAVGIMFSYVVLVIFLGIVFTLTGQSIFGNEFPQPPFLNYTLSLVNPCNTDDWLCQITFYIGQFSNLMTIPIQFSVYLFEMFIFFITSPIYFWLGIIFIPAGVMLLILLIPIITKILDLIVKLIQAIAEALPF